MRLSTAGRAAMGTGPAVSIDGATPAALVGKVTGGYLGPSWLTSTKILYQSGGTGSGPWILQSYNTGTLATATVDSSGENELASGQSIWAAWLSGSGVRTNASGLTGPFASAGLGDVSTDHGEIAIITSRATATGLTVYSSAGASLVSLPAVTLSIPLVRIRGHLLVYSDSSGWQMANVIGGAFSFAPRINEPVNWVTPVVTASGQQLVMERSERLTLRYAAKAVGWEIVAPGGLAFNPDVVEVSAGVIRLAWSLTQGEAPADLQMTDLTLATGATLNWVVSGSALVSSAGPTLTPTTFEVGPLQGSAGSTGLYPPLQDPMINPETGNRATRSWAMFFQTVRTGVGANTDAIASLPPSVPPPASFGIVSGDGVPVAATASGDTLALTSSDLSVGIATNPATKTIDLSAAASGGLAATFAAVSYRA
jgi:hypothetical protein